jgi:hypothetical protein
MTRKALEGVCSEFTTAHYIRTSLDELIEAGRVERRVSYDPSGEKHVLYAFCPYRPPIDLISED